MKPNEIEKKSFEIIEEESGNHGFSDEQWLIVRRVIHTTADFDYLNDIRIHQKAVETGLAVIRNGGTIFTDTNMARTGIRQRDLKPFDAEIRCLMAEEEIA